MILNTISSEWKSSRRLWCNIVTPTTHCCATQMQADLSERCRKVFLEQRYQNHLMLSTLERSLCLFLGSPQDVLSNWIKSASTGITYLSHHWWNGSDYYSQKVMRFFDIKVSFRHIKCANTHEWKEGGLNTTNPFITSIDARMENHADSIFILPSHGRSWYSKYCGKGYIRLCK